VSRFVVALGCLWLAGVGIAEEERPPRDLEFVCRFASGPITIDGKADEEAWKSAELIDYFYQPWRKDAAKAQTATKARLLWDRENLYFFAEMDDADLYADVKEHDGMTWDNDVFELFFKPADEKPGYYEFQVSAANTVMDMFLPRRGAGGYKRFIADGDFHIESKVALRGTLNKWSDRDQGWSVEGKIPWRDFVRTGGRPNVDERWKFTLCRYDYSVDFEGPALSVCAPLDSLPHPDFHHFEDYATLRFAGPAEVKKVGQIGEQFDRKQSAIEEQKQKALSAKSHVVGSPDPPLPYVAKRVLPELKPSFPIYVLAEPTTKRLLMIDQKWSYGPARICRTTDTPGELETLYDFPEAGVAYSLAVHPKYADNGYLYVGWNGAREGQKRSIVTRFTIDPKSHKFDASSELTILDWPSDGHNGAAIAFGGDGMLYVTSGDGTSDSDTNVAGQGLDHLLSKLLRIDVDHPEKDRPYSVPRDNPFVGQKNVRPETFAYGFRNPWRITVDPKTDAIWVGQNGQDLWEQVYLVLAGENYGWSVYEGSHPFYPERKLGPTPVTKPTLEHPHSEARSLTGGVVYYGKNLPELRGAYIYGDYSTGKIWAAKVEGRKVVWHREIADTPFALTCFALDADGELLITDHRGGGQGGLYTLEPTPKEDSPVAFPRKLSETGLFTSVAGHRVHPGLIPYDVNAPLWSDGAYKERYLYLPPATSDDDRKRGAALASFDFTSGDGGWNLPEGTVIVKSFALPQAGGQRRWIETRLLVKQQNEWIGYSYAWNEQQMEAMLVEAAGANRNYAVAAASGRSTSLAWHYPSRTECMVCHSRAANYVLGLSTPQFNREHEYGGVAMNQLDLLEGLGVLRFNWMAEQHSDIRERLKRDGKSDQEAEQQLQKLISTRDQREPVVSSLLSKPAADYPKLVDPYDAKADLTARAKSYLHANCAQCHVEAGGGNAQMQLAWSTPLEKMKLVDAMPVHHKFDKPDARLVAPGEPDRSVLLHRMAIRDRGQMPQLATNVVDERAVEMIREWIVSLKK
jgi:glucose/arabinose dehydrogenase